MTDPRLIKWAETMVHYSLALQPKQQLLIRADEAAIPLARAVYRSALHTGAYPHVQVTLDGLDEIFLMGAAEEQLDWVSPIQSVQYETIEALCSISAPSNTAALSGVDPARQARAQRANAQVRRSFFSRAAQGQANWTSTLYPTPAAAQNAGLSMTAYEGFVFGAMFLDRDDPAQAWRAFSGEQQKYIDYLNGVQTLRLVARDTDLTMNVGGRKWINSDGRRNFPSGEVFTGPIEDSVQGHVRYTFSTAHLGHEVDDVRLTFDRGRVIEADASRGLEFLQAMLETDAGARILGEVAIGNNYGVSRFTRSTLYDEKIGGTFHLALGNAYPETGALNTSAVHWDMVCDMRPDAGGGAIYADGTLIHENGRWLI